MSLKDRPIVGFALAVQRRYGEDRAGYLAAAVTYYAFLSLFPLLLLAFSVIGFLLAGDPEAQEELVSTLAEAVPGLESVLGDNIEALVDARAATGIIGLLGLLWTGLGATEAAGYALGRVFRLPPLGSLLRRKLWAVGTTVGLGLLALLALGVVAAVGNLPVKGVGGALLRAFGPLVGLGLDLALFLIAYRLLTQRRGPPLAALWKGALFAALGWTALKIVGTWYVARTVSESTAVYGTFAGAVGILLLLYLAARLLLYGAEVSAVAMERAGGRSWAASNTEALEEGGGPMGKAATGSDEARTTPELLRSIATDTGALVRKEVELARQEVVEGVMGKVKAVGAFGAAGVLGFLAVIYLGVSLAASLRIVLPAWAAWLATGGAFLVLTLGAVLFGAIRMKSSSIAPRETRRTVKEDVQWARAQLRR